MALSKKIILLSIGAMVLSACTSGQIKARKDQRDKAAQSSHIYCDFINGEVYPDVDVAVNLEMAKRCDSEGPLTITGYRSPSEAIGVIYCCSLRGDAAKEMKKEAAKEAKDSAASDLKLDSPKSDKAADKDKEKAADKTDKK